MNPIEVRGPLWTRPRQEAQMKGKERKKKPFTQFPVTLLTEAEKHCTLKSDIHLWLTLDTCQDANCLSRGMLILNPDASKMSKKKHRLIWKWEKFSTQEPMPMREINVHFNTMRLTWNMDLSCPVIPTHHARFAYLMANQIAKSKKSFKLLKKTH